MSTPGKTQMYDYLRNFYSYGDGNINSPSSSGVLLPTPQALGCKCLIDSNCENGQVCCEQNIGKSFCVPKEDCMRQCENNEDCVSYSYC
jgi:hypothetical protein